MKLPMNRLEHLGLGNKKRSHTMAKLTSDDVDRLQKEGVLNNSTVKSLKEKGLASSRKRG